MSVCLRSLAGFDWGGDWQEFCLAVGKALWGSKWYEVMPGEPWSDLEDQMIARELPGDPDAARQHWGSWSSKLETVLLVAVPSESGGRNSARILPGRDDVYIIPRADCIDGSDGNVYLSNRNIQACLVLKPLDERCIKMRQLAVGKSSQGKGFGRELVKYAHSFARERGYAEIVLHARETA